MGQVGELESVGWELFDCPNGIMGYVISGVCGPAIGSQAVSGQGLSGNRNGPPQRKNAVVAAWLLRSSFHTRNVDKPLDCLCGSRHLIR